MEWLLQLIKNCEADGFFGTVSLRFRDGRIVLVEKNETFTPESLEKNSKETAHA